MEISIPPSDLSLAAQSSSLNILAQHASFHLPPRSTGFITPHSIKSSGAVGTLLNHSEHRLFLSVIKNTLTELNKHHLKAVVCVHSLSQVKKILKFPVKPFAIAFEDPKLIASKVSIIKARPRVIQKFVHLLRGSGIIPICGAGVHSAKDVSSAYQLGCEGVLIASAIANAKNPVPLLKSLKEVV